MQHRLHRNTAWLWTLIIAAGASTMPAAEPADFLSRSVISDGNPATDDRAWAKTNINAVSFKTQALTTVDDYQFTSYYGADGKLIIGRRNLAKDRNRWTLLRTEFTSFNMNDSHNTSSIAIDGDGYLHVAWGVHANPLLYSRSRGPVVNDAPLHLVGERSGNAGSIRNALPFQAGHVTYPEFFNIPGSGDLLLTYRIGVSGNGKWQLARWNNAAKTWSGIHTAVNSGDGPQPWIDSDYGGDDLPNICAYHNKVVFNSRGRMHVSWTWRTGPDSNSGYTDYQTNHNIMYAYSDNGGVDWHRDNGVLYRRNGVHDIDENNAMPVVSIPEGSSLRNQLSSTIGPDGTYYIGSSWAPEAGRGNNLRQYLLVEYNGRQWKIHQVGQRKPEFRNKPIPESQLNSFSMRRPIVLADRENRVFLVFSDYQRGGGISVAFSEAAGRDDWQFIDLTTEDMGRWDPTYDLHRWQHDGILSVFYLPENPIAATPSVLEWDAKTYFAKSASNSPLPHVAD